MKLSVTSVMLPRWTLDETFDRLAKHGYDGIELRVRNNPDDPKAEPSYWGRHLSDVSPANVMDKVPAIRAAVKRTGVRVVALSPHARLGDFEMVERLSQATLAIDPDRPPLLRVDPARHDRNKPYLPQFLAVRSLFAEQAERQRPLGVKVIYETHVGTVAVTATRARALLDGIDPALVGAIYDIPNMIRTGLEDTRMGLEALGPYLAHCHVGGSKPVNKGPDTDGRDQWDWEMCDVRRAMANIPQIVADFKHVGYQGHLSLEEFGPGDDEGKLRDQGAYLRKLIG